MFVSVKEAVELTGKSQTTIYRLCKKRSHTRYVKKKDNKYYIDKAYLLATYPAVNDYFMENEEKETVKSVLSTQQDDIIEFTVEDTFEDSDEAIGEKIIDEISEKITERFNAGNELLELKNESVETEVLDWETIIGVSVGLLLIAGLILLLYYNAG